MRRLFRWRVISLAAFVLLFTFYVGVSTFVVRAVAIIDRSESEGRPADYNLPAKNVEFPSRNDGLNLKGWYISAPDKEHTVIFVHGFGGDRGSAHALDIGSGLWQNGFNVLMFDLRASGSSEGEMASGGYLEQDDLLGAVDFVRNTGIPSGNIGVIGFSMGAATSILGASKEPSIQAIVSDSTYANVLDLIAEEVARATPMPAWIVPVFQPGIIVIADLLYGIKLDEIVPERAASSIDYPIFLIHGTDDTRVPFKQSIRVHGAAASGSTLWKVDGVRHARAFEEHPSKYIENIIRYFRTRFGLPFVEIVGEYVQPIKITSVDGTVTYRTIDDDDSKRVGVGVGGQPQPPVGPQKKPPPLVVSFFEVIGPRELTAS
jgi:pimeloyl-ACP methyl ester carboxylesterase